jgi:hypothetical protein
MRVSDARDIADEVDGEVVIVPDEDDPYEQDFAVEFPDGATISDYQTAVSHMQQ